MSQQLARALLRLQIERKTETLRRGWPALPPWLFCTKRGTPLDTTNADKAFKRILKDAELPLHFTPHCLRHTFASLLLQQGESPAYVQRQLGHASISSRSTPTAAGSRWATRPRSIASTTRLREQVVAKW